VTRHCRLKGAPDGADDNKRIRRRHRVRKVELAVRIGFELASGGNGWLRIYEFRPTTMSFERNLFTVLGQFETDSDSQFNFPYAMTPTNPFVVIGTIGGAPSGGNASVTWPGLAITPLTSGMSRSATVRRQPPVRAGGSRLERMAAPVAPTVSLTNPANGAAFTAPATINLGAAAADMDGSVTNVAFYAGKRSLATIRPALIV